MYNNELVASNDYVITGHLSAAGGMFDPHL